MRRVLAVILLSLAAVAAPSTAHADGQTFFYEARVVGTDGNPLTGRQTFRLKADIDGKEFTSDVVAVEAEANGTVRVPFLIGGGAKDLNKMANVILTAQWRTPSSGEWVRVGPVQRLGSAVAVLVANEAAILTNDQEIVISSDLTLDSLKTDTLEVGDIRPTSIANPEAIELGDASGKMTVQCGSVKLDPPPKRILSICGPFPATNSVWFGPRSDVKELARVSFVYGDTSPWNSSHGIIYCKFTAPCDCIYEIQMAGGMGTPTAGQQNLWEKKNATQQGRVFLGLATPDGRQWREPFDMKHGFSEQELPPRIMDASDFHRIMQTSRRWLAGTSQDEDWGKRDNALQIPMMCGETFYAVFYMGPIFVERSLLKLIKTFDEFVHGWSEGAAPVTWMKAAFCYYPLSANH